MAFDLREEMQEAFEDFARRPSGACDFHDPDCHRSAVNSVVGAAEGTARNLEHQRQESREGG